MLSLTEITLALAAFVIGLTGAWSPCGFSMVETIGPTGHSGGRRTTFAACLTFAAGALVGGALTFGGLAAAGEALHGVGGRTAYLVAAGIALLAALGEARGVRILPQVRRQLPEHWRRVMPMPVAAGLYGVLLGLGFTTFVLTLGVWALGGMSIAIGDPALGLLLGVAFGAGRALPVALLAPVIDKPIGRGVVDAMAQRPILYRSFRLGDAVALLAAAVVLTGAEEAEARPVVVTAGSNPTVAGVDLAWQAPDGTAVLRRGGGRRTLPGTDPALGGPYAAVRSGGSVRLLDRRTLAHRRSIQTPRADALAVSRRWLVTRQRTPGGGDRLVARSLDRAGRARSVARIGAPAQLGRPSLDGSLLVYAVNARGSNRIVSVNLKSGQRRTLLQDTTVQLTNASVLGRFLLYVRTTGRRQELRLKRRGAGGSGRRLLSMRRRTSVMLWSTALGGRHAYVTRLRFRRGNGVGTLLQIRR